MTTYEQAYHALLAEHEALKTERDSLTNALRECEVDRKADAATVLEVRAQLVEATRKIRVRPDYALHCDECGAPHWFDTSIPSEVWNQIAPAGGVLCLLCIDERVAALGLTVEAEFYFTGSTRGGGPVGVVSKHYAESHGEVQALQRQLAEATRVPEDAELDTLLNASHDYGMKLERDREEYFANEGASRLLLSCFDAITSLRRRVAELENAMDQIDEISFNAVSNYDPHLPAKPTLNTIEEAIAELSRIITISSAVIDDARMKEK